MKKFALFCIAIGSAFSYSCLAQDMNRLSNNQTGSPQINTDNDLAVVSYHVEEKINMNFGSSVTTYDVPSLNLVSTKDLGRNNTRTVTPKYAKVRAKAVAVDLLKANDPKRVEMGMPTELKVNDEGTAAKKDYVNIDVVGTYERIMDKGYKSVDMIIKVADRHFFEGDLVLAAKWYTELFNNKSDLDAVYYYRYGQSLIAVGQVAKGNEMMKIFETKSL